LRRQRLDPEMAKDVLPKNIILAGPTGVGKTELARRLALLLKAPFLKVEATKYTEVGYFGKDVETIARDLVEIGVAMVQAEETAAVEEKAAALAEEELLDALVGLDPYDLDDDERADRDRRRVEFRARLRDGKLEQERITLSIEDKVNASMDVFSAMGVEQMGLDMEGFMIRVAPPRLVERTLTMERARR
jgi:ATP-dependent HslUV protease ATP-binding subunit HslU